tara:strand:+ start:3867 stop:4724 length:858 start_codon:yes stop_codon:yes gene_type:complete
MSSIIFNNYLKKSNETNKKVNEFLDKKDLYIPNIFNILNTIPSNNVMFYFFLVLIIYAFLRSREIRINDIFIFLVCVLVVYLLIQKDYVNFIKFTDNKKIQIKFLEKLLFNNNSYETAIIGGESLTINNPNIKTSYFYYDPIIIEFYYNIRDVINYDISSYINSLTHTNNLLKISYQSNILKENLKENYEQAIIEKDKALNFLSYMIFNVPTNNITYNKYKDSLNILHSRLNAHIDNMAILFKDITKQKNDDTSMYLPTDTFEKNNDAQPFDKDNRKSPLVHDLY